MKKFPHSRYGACKGAALIIVLAFVVITTALGLAYFSRTTTDRQLAQSSYNDTSADLLARSALDVVVSDFKQEIATANAAATPSQSNIQPQRSGDDGSIPNLIRRSVRNDPILPPGVSSMASAVSSGPVNPTNPQRGEITSTRWNSHYLIPPAAVPTFTPPDWVLVTAEGPKPTPAPNEIKQIIGRYAFAAYDEGGLMNMNLAGFPNYASLSQPTRPTRPHRRLPARYPSEESEIMLAAFTPNDPACQSPKFTPGVTNTTLAAGVPCSLLFNTNHNPTSFSANFLPPGLSINTSNGNIFGTPTSPGQATIIITCSNGCPPDDTMTWNVTITGFPFADSTPWPVNLARKGTVAFADLTALPPSPTSTQINNLMGWRNYATTQQLGAFFPNGNPSFPLGPAPTATPTADLYARYFLGAIPPFNTPFTGVSTSVQSGRTDQAIMTRQELIRLQRTIGFDQNLLQYLGTFSREYNRPAPSWQGLRGSLAGARWDMNNLQLIIPQPWFYPGNHGQGHAYGKQRGSSDLEKLFGLQWVFASNNFTDPTIRFTDPNYYGHWKYVHQLNAAPFPPDNPDFFQVIDYAMNQAIGVNDPNHVRKTFSVGAAIIDQYDTDDLFDSGSGGAPVGNTITVIDYLNDETHPENYVYGIEKMSTEDPNHNLVRPPFAPYPAPVPTTNAQLNRRFENVGEFGYAYNPASTTPSKTLDFASATSNDSVLLDFFSYNMAGNRAGIVNLNTRNAPVLASLISGAWVHDPGDETLPPPSPVPPTTLVSQADALAAAQAIVQETTNTTAGHGPVLTRADVARLAAAVAAAPVPNLATSDEAKQTIARTLAEVGQARTWNLMIDVIAQTGKYAPGTPDLTDPSKFIVQGEKRYWLHIALDRDDGTVLGTQLEEVIE